MVLITGGAYQGKCAYADQVFPEALPPVDAGKAECESFLKAKRIDHLHLWIRRQIENGDDPEAQIIRLIEENPEAVILMDEVGSGVVPIDPIEERYREAVGRAGCLIAASSKRVIRMLCGVPLEIKG